MSGNTDVAKGRIKEAAGALTGNDKLREEGKTDQAVGNAKKSVQKVVSKVEKAAEKAPEKIANDRREVKRGEFTPRLHVLDTQSGVMKWVPNPALVSIMPARTRQLVDSLERQMRAGTFTPIPPTKTLGNR